MTPFEDFYLRLYDATDSINITYGKRGPRESWNRWSQSASSAFSGSSHSNPSRPSTPINISNNGGLHPHWPNTPPRSRPGSCDVLSKYNELQEEHERLKQRLDQKVEEVRRLKDDKEALAAANRRNLELEKQISDRELTIERLRNRSALSAIKLGDHRAAASEYEQLAFLKQDEQKLKASLKDEQGRRDAQDAELYYLLQQGKALANDEQDQGAETILANLLDTKLHLDTYRAPNVKSDDIQTLLCDVLCRQGKTTKAKKFYHQSAVALEYGELNPHDKAGCTWVLQNAMNYARILTKEKTYDQAIYWLSLVWSKRYNATSTGLLNLEKEALRIVEILEHRAESEYLFKLLKKLCNEHNPTPVSDSVLYCHAKLGMLLHYRGEPDAKHPKENSLHDHTKATYYLQQAWNDRQKLEHGARDGVGWALAQSMVYFKKYTEAKVVLIELQSVIRDDVVDTQASKNRVSALLAHTQLMLGDLAAAEASARAVYKKNGVKNIFPDTTSSSIDYTYFHHADTLIQALSKQKGTWEKRKDRFHEADNVWASIYKARDEILGTNKTGKLQLQQHIKAAKILASERDAAVVANSKKKKSDIAIQIRNQIAEIERRLK